MHCDQVNFDYEFTLYGEIHSSLELNREFEYIYFFCNDSRAKLCPYRPYPKDYLEYLESLGISLPVLDCTGKKKMWWGSMENMELAKILNSKITSTNIAKKNQLNPPGECIVGSLNEIINHVDNYGYQKWLLRNPHAMAGKGSILFNKNEISFLNNSFLKSLKKNPYILAPYFSRLMDLGFIFDDGEISITWNLNSKNGQFKGGILFENLKFLEEFILDSFNINLQEILEIEKKIYDYYKDLGNKDILQIDTFIFQEDSQRKFYPLVEVNARKSMGYFINKMKRFLPANGIGMLLSWQNSDLKKVIDFNERLNSIKEHLWNKTSKTGLIPVSPVDGKLSSFFLSANSLPDLDYQKITLWDAIKLPGKILSPTYDFLPKTIKKF